MRMGDIPDAGTSIGVGSTEIIGGTDGRILSVAGSVLGQMTTTGSGTVVVLATGATLVTPALGVATATSIAIGGATIGAHALAVTGTVLLNSALTYGGVTLSNAVTGTGAMVLATSPTLTTPVLGVAAGTSLALGGAAIGSNALAATGTANISGAVTGLSYTSGAPNGGTAGVWKLGIRVADTVILDTTQYIQLDVGGTLYKVAIAT